MKSDEKVIVQVMNHLYNVGLKLESDQFSCYDAFNNKMLFEIKVRNADHGDVCMEVSKVMAIRAEAIRQNKKAYFCQVNNKGIQIIDVFSDYTKFTVRTQKTTSFSNQDMVVKDMASFKTIRLSLSNEQLNTALVATGGRLSISQKWTGTRMV